MATREASSWRAVTHLGSRALRPYSPKASRLPRLDIPLIRGWLCGLRYLTLLGIKSMAFLLGVQRADLGDFRGGRGGRRRRVLRLGLADRGQELLGRALEQHLLEDPALDPDGAHRGVGGVLPVVDVGGERVQRHP